MNVLPGSLYPMQMLPNHSLVKFFKSLHSMICTFVWKYKRPRLKLEKLQLPVDKEVLTLPNIMHHHWASQIRDITEWIRNDRCGFQNMEGC